MSDNYFDKLLNQAVCNCENITCIRCPMFSIMPLKNQNHCLLSEMIMEARRLKNEAEETLRKSMVVTI